MTKGKQMSFSKTEIFNALIELIADGYQYESQEPAGPPASVTAAFALYDPNAMSNHYDLLPALAMDLMVHHAQTDPNDQLLGTMILAFCQRAFADLLVFEVSQNADA